MEEFSYALNAVLPTLLLLLLGWALRRRGLFPDSFIAPADRICMRLLFPVLLFRSMYQGGGALGPYLRGIAFAYGVIALSACVGVLVVPRFIRDRRRIAVVIQSLYRGNYTLYGIPFSELLGGSQALGVASAIVAATVPALNFAAATMYSYYAGAERKSFWQIMGDVFKNPLVWSIFLGLGFRLIRLPLPAAVSSVMGSLAAMASPLAFMLLGAKLRLGGLGRDLPLLCFTVAWKLLAMPAIFLPAAIGLFHMRGTDLIPILLFLAAPSAITTAQLATMYGADDRLAGDIVAVSTLMSTGTLCAIVTLLRALGIL